MSIVKGIAYWTSTVRPNKKFDPDGVWTVDVCNLDRKNIDIVESNGLTIKNKNDIRENYITIKRNVWIYRYDSKN